METVENLESKEKFHWVECNFNDYVIVKLSEKWEKIYNEYLQDSYWEIRNQRSDQWVLSENFKKKRKQWLQDKLSQVDKDWVLKIQLHELMHIFWPSMVQGGDLPFKNMNIIMTNQPSSEVNQDHGWKDVFDCLKK